MIIPLTKSSYPRALRNDLYVKNGHISNNCPDPKSKTLHEMEQEQKSIVYNAVHKQKE